MEIPFFIAGISVALYRYCDRVNLALDALAELLPTILSILIGFTVMLITLLLTITDNKGIEALKNTPSKKEIGGKTITLYQELHVQFTHSLFSEIFALLIVIFYLFLNGLGFVEKAIIGNIFLFLEVYYTLNVLLSIMRGITNLYFPLKK